LWVIIGVAIVNLVTIATVPMTATVDRSPAAHVEEISAGIGPAAPVATNPRKHFDSNALRCTTSEFPSEVMRPTSEQSTGGRITDNRPRCKPA
jgi:hypothetical protein